MKELLKKISSIIPDKLYLRIKYFIKMKKRLDLDNPKTFNEKLQWLKLYDRKNEYTIMVDKYEVKKYVADKIGEEYIIPSYGVYEKFEEIDINKLPDKFVIKCTHDSGGIVIVEDKSKFDIKAARKKIKKSLKSNYYFSGREWPYKNVKPRIIIEKYINEKKEDLPDYKIFCFNGIPKICLVCSERFSKNMFETWFDINWNFIEVSENNHPTNKSEKKPTKFAEMIELAKKLSENIPFIRVDFYETNEKIYFGELTFFPASGYEKFNPEKWNQQFGEWINLPKDRIKKK